MDYLYDSIRVIGLSLLIRTKSTQNNKPMSKLGRYLANYLYSQETDRVTLAVLINYGLLTPEQEQAILMALITDSNYFGIEEAAEVLEAPVEIVEGFLQAIAAEISFPIDKE